MPRTPMRPTRRLLWAGAIAGLLLVVAAIVVSLLLDEQRVRHEIEQRLTALVGRPVAVRGAIDYGWVPTIAFELREVEIAGWPDARPATPLLALARVSGSVRAASLVSGRIEIGDVRLEGVRAVLAVDADGRRNWDGLFPDAPATPGAPVEPPARWALASLAIVDAEVEYRDARDGTSYAFREARVELGRVELPEPFDLRVGGRAWVGDAERVQLALRGRAALDLEHSRYGLDDVAVSATLVRDRPVPLELAAQRLEYASGEGGTAAIRALVANALGARAKLDLAAESLATTPRVSGALAVEPFAPREVAQALAVELPVMTAPDALSRADFAAQVAYGAGVLRLDQLQAGLDDTRLTGDVAVVLEPRAWRFELAADRIVADRYLKPKKLRDRSPVELPLDFLRGMPATGRLRIGELEIEGTKLKGVTVDLGDVARGGQ